MPESRLNFAASQKPAQIQENMIAYMRLFAGLPGMLMVDTKQLFWFISHKPAPGNVILRARWSEAEVEQKMDDLFSQVGAYLDQIDWMVFPGDQPPDLRRRLEARGMRGSRGGNWMWADLTTLGAGPLVAKDFHIQRVTDDQKMAEWVSVSEQGFGQELGIFYDAYDRHGYGSRAISLHYTGYLGDTPVTSGTLLDAGGCAAIYDISTPPAYRRLGYGGAITHALMAEIRRRGYPDTWIWSSNLGRSVYQKLGFMDADFGQR